MTTTATQDKYEALRAELFHIYETDGRQALFARARGAALRHDVTDLVSFIYAVYKIGETKGDPFVMASAVAQYAPAALLDDDNAADWERGHRCAYIAAKTLLEFQDDEYVTFQSSTVLGETGAVREETDDDDD
jgi:hypothetical protein